MEQEIDACRVPKATYRLQLSAGFGFKQAQAIVPYVHRLGISDLYLSPILKARPGSTHGYDVCDPTQLNPELGAEEDFDALSSTLKTHGMGLVVDIVPNHMGVGHPANRWWMDVLENGPASAYAGYFDIDWSPVTPELSGKVLLAVLEDQYGRELERGKFSVSFHEGAFWLHYKSLVFPLAPKSYPALLQPALEILRAHLGEGDEDLQETQSILTALAYLPSRNEAAADRLEERQREKEVVKRRLARLLESSSAAAVAVQASLLRINGDPAVPGSFVPLSALIDAQAYRLAFWRVSAEEINYRRFFDVDDLAALQAHRPQVFIDSHACIMRLLSDGHITGLRVDHADGLRDPAGYFWNLQVHYLLAKLAAARKAPISADWQQLVEQALRRARARRRDGRWPLYVVAEKILHPNERVRADWAVYGTTGYDFLGDVNRLLVNPHSRQALGQTYAGMAPRHLSFDDEVNTSKKAVMLTSMASEVNGLGHRLERLAKRTTHFRDFTLNAITFALREVLAGLNVYRTYLHPGQRPAAADLRWIEEAVAEAKRRNLRTAPELFDFVADTLTFGNLGEFSESDRDELEGFVLRFQQLSGSVMAKGVEDTAFYRHVPLASLNEVGGAPEHFGETVAAFHRANQRRARHWPHSMLATSTHDTKRGEDLRPRIALLSEVPRVWRAQVVEWSRQNRRLKRRVVGGLAPDGNDEYLLYQTLVGVVEAGDFQTAAATQMLRQRVTQYMLKAMKEAKVRTSWMSPNAAYESATEGFIAALLDTSQDNPFLPTFRPFQTRVARAAHAMSLAQQALHLTCPGIPDIYRGAEVWDTSLVDPDNRRPVDFARNEALLAALRTAGPQLTRLSAETPSAKLELTHALIQLRAEAPTLFSHGDYIPLRTTGRHRGSVVAFARHHDGRWLLVAVPHLMIATGVASLANPESGRWEDTAVQLPEEAPTDWRNVLSGGASQYTGAAMGAGVLFAYGPVAVLYSG